MPLPQGYGRVLNEVCPSLGRAAVRLSTTVQAQLGRPSGNSGWAVVEHRALGPPGKSRTGVQPGAQQPDKRCSFESSPHGP